MYTHIYYAWDTNRWTTWYFSQLLVIHYIIELQIYLRQWIKKLWQPQHKYTRTYMQKKKILIGWLIWMDAVLTRWAWIRFKQVSHLRKMLWIEATQDACSHVLWNCMWIEWTREGYWILCIKVNFLFIIEKKDILHLISSKDSQ
jgi:hypothetical protein